MGPAVCAGKEGARPLNKGQRTNFFPGHTSETIKLLSLPQQPSMS